MKDVIKRVYDCDNLIDNTLIKNLNEHPYRTAVDAFEKKAKKYLEEYGYKNEKYFLRLRILWMTEFKLLYLSKQETLEEKDTKRMLTNVLEYQRSDFELLFDIAKHLLELKDKIYDKITEIYHCYAAISDIIHEVGDYEEDINNDEYNTLIIMKKVGLTEKFLFNIMERMYKKLEELIEEVHSEVIQQNKKHLIYLTGLKNFSRNLLWAKTKCKADIRKILKEPLPTPKP